MLSWFPRRVGGWEKENSVFALQQEPNAAKYGMISRTKTMQVVEIINFQVNILR